MALESLAALGVASNIVQFVDFGCRLFSESKELYMSSNGLASEAVELKNITRSLSRLSNDIVVGPSCGNQPSSNDVDVDPDYILPTEPPNAVEKNGDDFDFLLIAKDCKKIADELFRALDQLRAKDTDKMWQCFRVTLKRVWKSEKIVAMESRMERLSSQLTICLVKILK